MVQVITSQQYAPTVDQPDIGNSIASALYRAYQIKRQQAAEDIARERTALEARGLVVREAAERRQQDRLDQAEAQAQLNMGRSAEEESLKSIQGESAAPILAAGQAPIAAPGGGPPGLGEVQQRLQETLGAMGSPLARAMGDMGPQDLKAVLGPGYIPQGEGIVPALVPQVTPELKPGARPLLGGVTLPGMRDRATGAAVPQKRVPIKFKEDIKADEAQKNKEKVELVGAEEAAKIKARGKQIERTVDLGDREEYIYTDGTSEIKKKGATPKTGEDTKYDFEEDIHVNKSGKKWFDGTAYKSKADQGAARTYATQQGIKFINDKDTAKALAGAEVSREDMDRVFGQIVPKLAKHVITRPVAGVKNKVESFLQTDEELAAFESNWESFVRAALNVIPAGRGFRMNETEMRRILSANRPSNFDTQDTALQKKKNITAAFDSLENEVLGKGEATPSATPGAATETKPMVARPGGIDDFLKRFGDK